MRGTPGQGRNCNDGRKKGRTPDHLAFVPTFRKPTGARPAKRPSINQLHEVREAAMYSPGAKLAFAKAINLDLSLE
jgi:hypothetical protein